MIKKDIVGKKFGRLTVLDDYIKIPNGTKWKCYLKSKLIYKQEEV